LILLVLFFVTRTVIPLFFPPHVLMSSDNFVGKLLVSLPLAPPLCFILTKRSISVLGTDLASYPPLPPNQLSFFPWLRTRWRISRPLSPFCGHASRPPRTTVGLPPLRGIKEGFLPVRSPTSTGTVRSRGESFLWRIRRNCSRSSFRRHSYH